MCRSKIEMDLSSFGGCIEAFINFENSSFSAGAASTSDPRSLSAKSTLQIKLKNSQLKNRY